MDKKEKENLGYLINRISEISAEAERYRERSFAEHGDNSKRETLLREYYHAKFRYWELVLAILVDHDIRVHESFDEKHIRYEMEFADDRYATWGGGKHLRTAGL